MLARLSVALVVLVLSACRERAEEGEPCDFNGQFGVCEVDGKDGFGLCLSDLQWSECFEECGDPGASRACEGGVQYCLQAEHPKDGIAYFWGRCVEQVCAPDDTMSCPFAVEVGCVLSDVGVSSWEKCPE